MAKSRSDGSEDALAKAHRQARATLTTNIRALRAAAGLSQAELAERAGLSVVYVNALEGLGPQNPTLSALAALATALGCTPDRLLAPAPAPVRRPPGRPSSTPRTRAEPKLKARRVR